MSDQDGTIFENKETTPPTEPPAAPEQQTSTTVDPYADLLQSIKTEDGRQKYQTVEEALKALPFANEFIGTLKSENTILKEQNARSSAIEDVLSKIDQDNTDGTPPAQDVDLSQLETLIKETVSDTLSSQDKQKVAKTNADSVINKMTEVYGDKAEEVFIKTAQDNGLDVGAMNALAAKAPQAALKLAGISVEQSTTPAKSSSTISTDAFAAPSKDLPSAKIKRFGTTQDDVQAWHNAGKLINQ